MRVCRHFKGVAAGCGANRGCFAAANRATSRLPRGISAVNDNFERPVYIIVGRVWRRKHGSSEGCHVLLSAPDDDTAVRAALEALAQEGYVEAELDQIGEMSEMPDDEPHMSAYQGAVEGEVSIVTFTETI